MVQHFNINHFVQQLEFSSRQLNLTGSAMLHSSNTARFQRRAIAVLNSIHKL